MNNQVSTATVSRRDVSEEAVSQKEQSKGRILFASDCLGRNGISTHMMTLMESLPSRGWTVGLVYGEIIGGCPLNREYLKKQGIWHRQIQFPDFWRDKGGLSQLATSYWRSRGLLHRFSPDVIHVHGLGLAPLLKFASIGMHCPIVSTLHAPPMSKVEYVAKKLGPLVKTFSWLLGDRVIAISEEMRAVLKELWRISSDKIVDIRHGVDSTYFYPPSSFERNSARNHFGLSKDSFSACILGRLYRNKNHRILFEAVASLKQKGIHVDVLVAGAGYLEEELISQKTEII